MKIYTALETKSFTEGQEIADIIEGEKYQGDKENEYFVGRFDNTIYLPLDEWEKYFKTDERASHRKATNKYFKNNTKSLYIRLFPSDKDIIDHLATIKEPTRKNSNKNGQSEYIRQLIRADIQRKNKNKL